MTDAFETLPAKTHKPDDVIGSGFGSGSRSGLGSSLLFFGDHASRYIPKAYDNLGLSGDDLTRHIAWDIGTDELIRNLCQLFGCPAHIASLSRLVIDMNRDPSAQGLIPEISDGTHIPANCGLSAQARADRLDRYYHPYHEGLSRALDALANPFIISVHSFTPKPLSGAARTVDIGFLVKHDPESAALAKTILCRANPEFHIGINEPYSAYDLNYTVDRHIAHRGWRHLAIEIRQDHLDTTGKIRIMTNYLSQMIAEII